MVNDAKILYTRKRLSKVLPKIWKYPLTLVKAPVCYGKTTAIAEYSQKCKANVLWQTVYDSSVTSFWNGFSRLFENLDPICAKCLSQLGVSDKTVFIEQAVELLGSVTFPQKTLLVLDDYNLLLSDVIDRFFERLAKAEISGLHIVIVSRRVFGKNTTELSIKGYCLVLDKSYFELTYREVVEYCRMCGVRLNAKEAALLHSYTEGWITAVYLCILGYRRYGRIDRYFASLDELIDMVVYQPCSAEMKEFLIMISIFTDFSLPQAEYMWRKGNAAHLLVRLTAENAFITFDYDSRTYCMHNILTGFLRQLFDRQDLDRRRACWRRAGEWYSHIGDYSRAMDCFYQGADFDQLLIAFEAARGTAFAGQMKEARNKYFQECPAEIKKRHPLAAVIYAYSLFLTKELELLTRQLEELAGFIKGMPGIDDQAGVNLRGEFEALKGVTAYNDINAMTEHFKAAGELLHGPSIFLDPQTSWTFGSPSVLYLYYRESGQLETLVKTVTEEIPNYYYITSGHGSGAEYVMAAERYYYIGDFDNAEIVAHKALHIAQSKEQISIILCAKFVMIRLALVRGEFAAVRDSLRRMREEIKKQPSYMHIYIYTLDMCESFIFSCLKQADKIPAWIYRGDMPDIIYAPIHAFLNILWGKALLISSQYHKLTGVADQMLDSAAVYPNLLAKVYIYIFAAGAREKLGRRQEARAMLQEALNIAVPDHVVMPFVENSEYIADLLIDLTTTGHYRDFIGRVCSMFPAIAAKWQAVSTGLDSAGGERLLTEREKVIVELVAEGMSNEAIGETLRIAKDTVKKALHNIFIKLGVNNRTELTKVFFEQKIK
ncbi:MAG: LuxR C-terminal-related transcriptional regulator [Veillonellales bacterium]